MSLGCRAVERTKMKKVLRHPHPGWADVQPAQFLPPPHPYKSPHKLHIAPDPKTSNPCS